MMRSVSGCTRISTAVERLTNDVHRVDADAGRRSQVERPARDRECSIEDGVRYWRIDVAIAVTRSP